MTHAATADYMSPRMGFFSHDYSTDATTNLDVKPAAADSVVKSTAIVNIARLCAQGSMALTRLVAPSIPTQPSARTYQLVFQHAFLDSFPSAFAELDAIRADDTEIQGLISNFTAASNLPYKVRLAARLSELIDSYKDDFEGRVFSADSLRSLMEFLESSPQLKYPTLTVTPSGCLYASWKQGRNHIFSVQFLETYEARFVVLRPNPRHAGRVLQLSGKTTTDGILDAVRTYSVSDWAFA